MKNALLRLNRSDDHVTLGISALRVSRDINGVTKRKVNEPTLVGVHRCKPHSAARLHSLLSITTGQALDLVATPALISLDVNNDGIVEADALGEHGGEHNLERVQRNAMTADKDREVSTADIQDQFTLVSIILINRTSVLTKAPKDTSEDVDGRVGNDIKLVIGQASRLLETRADDRELVGLLQGFLAHSNLQIDNVAHLRG